MRARYKADIGCLVVILLPTGTGAYFWFTQEPRPIVVAAPGAGGERFIVNGLPANYFEGTGPGPHPAILLIGGSEGGLTETRNSFARQLAAEGFSVLYPGYFATSESNRSFDMVPLETFSAELDWLENNSDIQPAPVGAIGHSKGADCILAGDRRLGFSAGDSEAAQL